jgi:carbamoyl-phosphate synthase large subunit
VSNRSTLVTGVSGETGQGIIKGLSRLDPCPTIVGADYSDDNAGFQMCDITRTVPGIYDARSVETLAKLIAEYEVDVVFLGIDGEVEIVAPRRAELERLGCRVAVSDTELVDACADKLKTPAMLAALGLDAPRTLSCEADIEEVLEALGLPIVIKPRRGNGSHGVYVCRDEAQLREAWSRLDPPSCAQEYIHGPEYTCSLLFDRWGGLRDFLIMERELQAGRTMRSRVVRHSGIEAFIEGFGGVCGALGSINLQLRVTEGGRVLVFEINPRFSGSTSMRVAAGYNEPARLFEHLADGKPIVPDPVQECSIYRYYTEFVDWHRPSVVPIPDYQAVVWDCGDTLLTLQPSRETLCMRALERMGITMERAVVANAYRMLDFSLKQHASALQSQEQKRQFFVDHNTRLAEALGISASASAFDGVLYETFRELRSWVAIDGSSGFLERLAQRARLFVVANWDVGLHERLHEAGLAGHFEGIYDSQMLGVEKPNPEIFKRFSARSGVDLETSVYVGNEYRADVDGSRNAGMTPVLLDWRGHYSHEIDAHYADSWDALGRILALA